MKSRRKRRSRTIKPSEIAIQTVERELGPLPKNASKAQAAKRYQLWQAQELIRMVRGQQ